MGVIQLSVTWAARGSLQRARKKSCIIIVIQFHKRWGMLGKCFVHTAINLTCYHSQINTSLCLRISPPPPPFLSFPMHCFFSFLFPLPFPAPFLHSLLSFLSPLSFFRSALLSFFPHSFPNCPLLFSSPSSLFFPLSFYHPSYLLSLVFYLLYRIILFSPFPTFTASCPFSPHLHLCKP